jgi:predicted transcriptional regulator YheO
MRTFEAEDKLISAILLKCHQSEAAKIKQLELGKKLSMESDNRIEQAIGKVLGYPAYKDDQKNFPNATESNGVCVGDHVAESLVMELVDRFKAIRSDQNKKIAKALNDIGLWDSKSRMYQLIAKLQKGEF